MIKRLNKFIVIFAHSHFGKKKEVKKKKAKFEIIPIDEREPTLAEFIKMNNST